MKTEFQRDANDRVSVQLNDIAFGLEEVVIGCGCKNYHCPDPDTTDVTFAELVAKDFKVECGNCGSNLDFCFAGVTSELKEAEVSWKGETFA